MAENKVNIAHVIAAVSAFVGLVLLVVGLATPGWTTEGGLPEGILGDIGAAIFTGYQLIAFPGMPFGYSFYLTWAQTLFSVGGGVIILLEERKVTEEDVATVRALNKI